MTHIDINVDDLDLLLTNSDKIKTKLMNLKTIINSEFIKPKEIQLYLEGFNNINSYIEREMDAIDSLKSSVEDYQKTLRETEEKFKNRFGDINVPNIAYNGGSLSPIDPSAFMISSNVSSSTTSQATNSTAISSGMVGSTQSSNTEASKTSSDIYVNNSESDNKKQVNDNEDKIAEEKTIVDDYSGYVFNNEDNTPVDDFIAENDALVDNNFITEGDSLVEDNSGYGSIDEIASESNETEVSNKKSGGSSMAAIAAGIGGVLGAGAGTTVGLTSDKKEDSEDK